MAHYGGYPPAGGGYPPSGYPPAGGGYPPAGGGYPPAGGGYPPAGYPPTYGGAPGAPAPSFAGHPSHPTASFQGHWYASYYNQIQQPQMAEMRRWFDSVDRDRSNSISADELQNLAFNGRPIGFDIAHKLVAVFDKDRSGSIDFTEYATLHSFLTSMQQAFSSADTDRSGTLDAREIHTALRNSGFHVLDFNAVNSLFRKYNKRGHGVDFASFLAIAADVALLRSRFEVADTDRDGWVRINLNNLIEMTSDM